MRNTGKGNVGLKMPTGNALLHPEAGLADKTANEKGQMSALAAMIFFIGYGWQVSRPESAISPYDLLVVHPTKPGLMFRVQIKTVGKNRLVHTYATGPGKLKGDKRTQVSYAKTGIDWIIGVDLAQMRVHLYPLNFYKTRKSINVDNNASHPFPYVKDGRNYDNKKNKTPITLDNL